MNVRISEKAEEDLSHIHAQIAARNPDAADRFQIEAERAMALLGENPELGPRPGWETRHAKLRFWVISHFHNYLIYYEAHGEEVSIERVLDGRRDVRPVIEEGRENGS
jgi:plasmid stabilization system protein ParE